MDWRAFRSRFPLAEGEVFLNTGTLGCPSQATLDRMAESQLRLARTLGDWEYLNDGVEWIAGYVPEPALRERLGRLFGADPAGISLVQNATMGVNLVAQGLELEPGDEVIQTDQEHPGGRCAWEVLAERRRILLRPVHLPIPLEDPSDILARFEAAFSPRTKVLAIPHLTSGLGTVLPVKELCAMARARGVLSLVDGAQAPGQIPLDLATLGADAYAASLHKWLFAPSGNGFLYVRPDLAWRIWPTLASEAGRSEDPGFRLQQRGTGNLSLLHGLEAALDLFEEVGPCAWTERVRELGDRLRRGLAALPGVRFTSSLHPELCAGITSFHLEGVPSGDVVRFLWDRHRVRIRDVHEPYGLRVSTAAYTLEEDVDRLLALLAAPSVEGCGGMSQQPQRSSHV